MNATCPRMSPFCNRQTSPACRGESFKSGTDGSPLRCQAITVAAFTMKTLERHSLPTVEIQTRRSRSAVFNFGRFTDLLKNPEFVAEGKDLKL